jgi:hypothetical protein
MLAIVRIALGEFAKAFAPKVGTPAARDFLWLTVFFTLSAFIVFVGWSARDGIWERFEQVLLGALPGGGPPIRVATHIDLPQGLTPAFIDKFEKDFPGLDMVPMREFDGATEAVTFPGLSSDSTTDRDLPWGQASDGATAPFRGLAIATDSPLWRWIRPRAGDIPVGSDRVPLVIAANRSLFQKHFRYDKYRKAIVSDLKAPCIVRSDLPEDLSDIGQLDSLVLKVREWSDAGGGRESYQSFKVIWVDSFPLPDQVAVIMPLQTAEVAMAAQTWKEFNLYLEGQGAATQRVSTLRLKDIDALSLEAKSAAVRDFSGVAMCLGTVPAEQLDDMMVCGAAWTPEVANDSVVKTENDALKRKVKPGDSLDSFVPVLAASSFDMSIRTSPQRPMRKADVQRCTQKTRFADVLHSPPPSAGPGDVVADLTEESATVRWMGPSRIELPCNVLTASGAPSSLIERGNCTQAAGENARGVGRLEGYKNAMIYAGASDKGSGRPAAGASKQSLDDIVNSLLAWKIDNVHHAFRLDAAYESALVRFGVLSTIVDKMTVPLGGGLLVLYLVLSGVILATTFLHRRSQYGLLFMNGVMPWGIEAIVSIQIAISCAIGCVIGYAGFWVVATQMNGWLKASDIIRKAAFIIGLDVPTFLDNLPASSIAMIWIAMTLAGFLIGNIILRVQRISTASAPIDLIKS